MKAISQTLTSIGVFLLLILYTNVGFAQLPQKVLDTAKAQFELAYETEYGEPPAAKTTAKAMLTYKNAVDSFATNLGTRAGKEAKRLANMSRGFDKLDGPSLIDVLSEMRFDTLAGFGFSKSKVAELAEPDMPVNQMDGRLLIKDPNSILKLKENTEVIFPKGTYTVNEQNLSRILGSAGKKFPKGVAFVGDGKDKTTLKITDVGLTRNDIDRLSFRDMTIDCDNDGLFDKRQGSLTLRLSNVRLVRFDAGHGGCRLFSINDGLIVHATDTEFVGGYGRSPGNGQTFDSCDIFLGHFERCSFSGINDDLFRSIRERSSILWMDECQFDKEHRTNNAVDLKDCKFDLKPPAIEWVPEEDTEIGELGG